MFKILGITDERTDCDCCGKSNLKCTVALETEAGDTVYYGRHCAALAMHGSKSARNVSRVEVAAAKAVSDAEYNRQSKLARIADGTHASAVNGLKNEANYRYNRTQRPLSNSFFAVKENLVVRVDGNDAADVAFYLSEGFVREVSC